MAKDFTFALAGCKEKCFYIDHGNIDRLIELTPYVHNARGIKKSSLFDKLIDSTGLEKTRMELIFSSLQYNAIQAGFSRFKAELIGSNEALALDVNLRSGEWSFHSLNTGTLR